jgi:hypothetical protein
MALLDISLITDTLVKLIKDYVEASPAWTGANLDVSALPPDKLTGDNTIGLYLYHIAEDPYFKNMPPPSPDTPPVRYVPMGVTLSYQLTAHTQQQNENDVKREQTMLGIATKALHDYPVIDDTTEIDGNKLLSASLRDNENRLRIMLQPLSQAEAVNYWTAGTAPLRLASYYQVSAVMLEPDEPQTKSSRVLQRGVYVFARGAPYIRGTEYDLAFDDPETGETRMVKTQPAQIPVNETIRFNGSELSGDEVTLILNNTAWDEPVTVNGSWNVRTTAEGLEADVQEDANGQPLLPGVYTARADVLVRRTQPDGTSRDFHIKSNETAFVVIPWVEDVTISADLRNVRGKRDDPTAENPVFKAINDGDVDPADVEVFVGEERYAHTTSGSNPSAGEWKIATQSSKSVLRLRLTAAAAGASTYLPIRILVNGAESNPYWID